MAVNAFITFYDKADGESIQKPLDVRVGAGELFERPSPGDLRKLTRELCAGLAQVCELAVGVVQ